jgi:hypothetical protein
MQSQVEVSGNLGIYIINKIQNKIRTRKQFEIFIKRNTINDGKGLWDDKYEGSVGIKIELGEKYLSEKRIVTNADIYSRNGHDLYIGLNRKVKVSTGKNNNNSYVQRANVPVKISRDNNKISIEFLDRGLMQAKVYVPTNEIKSFTEGFKVEKIAEREYVFTKYGDAAKLEVQY